MIPANVRQFGAKGDCVNDDGSAFAAALRLGIPVYAPNGHYLIGTGGSYSGMPIFLSGAGSEETGMTNGNLCNTSIPGTYIVVKDAAVSPFAMSGAAVRGSIFRDLAVLQQHPAPVKAWVPTAYRPVWVLSNLLGGVTYNHIALGGIYAVIDAAGNTARINLTDISGQVFSYLLKTDAAQDLSRASDVHIWPFWSNADSVMDWQQKDPDALFFRRQDSFQADNIFIFGAHACVRLSQGTTPPVGAPTAIHFGNLNCDSVKYAIGWTALRLPPPPRSIICGSAAKHVAPATLRFRTATRFRSTGRLPFLS